MPHSAYKLTDRSSLAESQSGARVFYLKVMRGCPMVAGRTRGGCGRGGTIPSPIFANVIKDNNLTTSHV